MQRFRIVPVLVLAFLVSPARAEQVLDRYDLDSLAYFSEAIVRVEVGDSEPFKTADGDCLVHTVKVLEVFKGAAKAGTSVRVTGLDAFHRAPGIAGRVDSWEPIQKGDVVYLFLVPNGKLGYAMYRLTNADWTVIESGARLLDGNNVYSFGQYLPKFGAKAPVLPAPGGFVAMTNTTFPGAPVLTRPAFEKRLQESQQTVARAGQWLTGEATTQTSEEILRFLRSRSDLLKQEMATSDAVGSKLVQKIAPVAAPADLASLLAGSPRDMQFQLDYILQSHAGRTYLLERVADPKETPEQRLECVRILSTAGRTYALEVGKTEPGEATPMETDFAQRLARLAVANLGTDLCAPLLSGVADCTNGAFVSNPRLASDLKAAATVLSDAFAKAAPVDQFRIAEALMQMGREPYRALLPSAGSLLTLVEPARDFDDALKRRALHLTCRFRNKLAVETSLKLILRPADGTPDIEIALDTQIGKRINTFGDGWPITAAIPPNVAGKYRVFLRDFLGDRPYGDGLGFDIDIPGN